MFSILRSKMFVAGLIAAALSLVAVERSDAQFRFSIGGGSSRITIGRPYYGGGYGYGGRYNNYGYYPYNYGYSGNYAPGWYGNPGYSYYPPVNNYYVTPPVPPPAPMSSTATIEVHVPANADLWFDGTKTTQTGTTRVFVTPPLMAGSTNSYELRATWMDANGAPVTEARMIQVQPGQQSVVSLMK